MSLLDELRRTWPAEACQTCEDLKDALVKLRMDCAYMDDQRVVDLVGEASVAVNCLALMVEMMTATILPSPALDVDVFVAIQAKWRQNVREYFSDLVSCAVRLGRVAKDSGQPDFAEHSRRLDELIDEMGDTFTRKYYVNGDLEQFRARHPTGVT